MKEKFGPLEKMTQKTIDINGDEIFHKNSRYTIFDHKRNEEILEELKVEPVDKKLIRYKSNLTRHVTEWTAAGWEK